MKCKNPYCRKEIPPPAVRGKFMHKDKRYCNARCSKWVKKTNYFSKL